MGTLALHQQGKVLQEPAQHPPDLCGVNISTVAYGCSSWSALHVHMHVHMHMHVHAVLSSKSESLWCNLLGVTNDEAACIEYDP